VMTTVGEEKVLTVDLFRESVTLRNAEGVYRTIPLEAFNGEVAGRPAPTPPPCEDETDESAEEISPELMYTSEFAIPEPRLVILTETVEAEAAPPVQTRKPERRRRGRRGGTGGGDRGNTNGSGGSGPNAPKGPTKSN
jgi:hypothetical protein